MATLIIPNTYLVSINGTSGSQPVTNVIGISADFTNAQNVAEQVGIAWKFPAGPLSKLPSAYQLTHITATDLSTADGDVSTVVATGIGGQVGVLATNAASALLSYSGGTRSRSSSGRMYFGPLGEGMIDNDGRTMAAATRTGMDAAFLVFQNQLVSQNLHWCVVSRKLQKSFPIQTGAAHTQPIIATQRRRIRGR